MSRRLLVVAYHWPPLPTVGATRWLAQVRHLRRLGHDVTVLTTAAFGSLPDDDEQDVVRSRDLAASGALRRALRRPPLPPPGTPPGAGPAPALLTRTLVPDAGVVAWAPGAALAARRLVRARGIECVVTTSPHESTHLVGLAVRGRAAWLADLRDGWTYEPLRPAFPTAAQRRLDERLERLVARRADGVLAATRPIADDLGRRLGVRAVHVPGGWDPELDAEVDAAEPPPLTRGRVSLVHTGPLRVATGRDPGPLLEALGLVREELAGRLELVLAGPAERAERALLAARGVERLARHAGTLARPEALALQRRADALLLLTSRKASVATGKLFEYLAAGRPILALAEGNEAARIVAETGTGLTVAPDDPAAIADGLRAAARGGLPFAPRGLDRYRYPGPAELVAEEIERALASRRTAAARANERR